jgi:hypothetical protein
MSTLPPATEGMQSNNSCITDPSTTSPTGARSKNDLLMDLRERWSEDNRPFHFQHALAVLMGHIGLLQNHDVPLLHRATGFPLSFVSRVVFELLRSPLWHSDHGYVDLVRTASCTDVKKLDSSLGELLQHDLFHEEIFSELEDDWYRLMGVTIEL